MLALMQQLSNLVGYPKTFCAIDIRSTSHNFSYGRRNIIFQIEYMITRKTDLSLVRPHAQPEPQKLGCLWLECVIEVHISRVLTFEERLEFQTRGRPVNVMCLEGRQIMREELGAGQVGSDRLMFWRSSLHNRRYGHVRTSPQ